MRSMASSGTGFRRLLQPLTTIAWRVGVVVAVVVVVVVVVAISPLRLTGMHGHAGWWMQRGHEAVADDVLGLRSCAHRALLAGIRFAAGWVGLVVGHRRAMGLRTLCCPASSWPCCRCCCCLVRRLWSCAARCCLCEPHFFPCRLAEDTALVPESRRALDKGKSGSSAAEPLRTHTSLSGSVHTHAHLLVTPASSTPDSSTTTSTTASDVCKQCHEPIIH